MTRRDQLDMNNLRLLMRFWLERDANCIDIGANVGEVLQDIVEIAPNGAHHAFEPLPEHVAALREHFPRVDVHELALSDTAGQASFTHVTSPEASGYSGFREQWYPVPLDTQRITVQTARLDDVLPADYRPDFIKVDVEGAEREVIRGGLQTLRRHRPIIVFEHFQGGADSYGYGPEEMHALLVGEANMRIYDIDGMGPYTPTRMREVFDSRRLWTWVGLP